MTPAAFFLACFAFGFVLCLVAFLSGSTHLHLHPHFHFHGHAGTAAGAPGHPTGRGKGGSDKFNFGTIAAFLTWFGGTGYILTEWGGFGLLAVVGIALVVGLAGGALIFVFVAKILAGSEQPLDPADFRIPGALGTVSSPVLPGGTGEMIFRQQGRRRGIPIRSDAGNPIPKGKEVVVTRYEDGIAYVREWDELTA